MTALEQSPVRATGKRLESGVILLHDVQSTYLDGAEAGLVAKFNQASDLSSTSDELAESASGWAETYHLSTARANVVRSFDLPRGARVLEIGAGCGAITRYLGEAGGIVDAIEPVPARATVARARTKDLPDVEVFIGTIENVPAEPVYDVVIVVGVLEYVGNGSIDSAPYAEFLSAVHSRLRPGGALLLAIENKLGVKYFAGSPEDHSGRIFDSIEGYPTGETPARTFSRRELERMLATAGLDARPFVAFPDYKMARTVMSVDLPEPVESLLYRIPTFPSPDRGRSRPKAIDERAAWKSAVEAGLAGDLGNSLVLTAYKGAPAVPLWPADRLATFFSDGRPARLTMRTDVQRVGDDGAEFVRAPLVAASAVDAAVLSSLPAAAYVAGTDALEAMAAADEDGIASVLTQWVDLVRATHASTGLLQLDLVPHNLVVTPSGSVELIDAEWRPVDVDPDVVIRRGVFWAAHRICDIAAPDKWGGLNTIGALAVYFGIVAGLPEDGSWIETFVVEEAAWQAQMHAPNAVLAAPEARRREVLALIAADTEKSLRAQLGISLTSRGLGLRAHEVVEIALRDRQQALSALSERDAALASAGNIGELLTTATKTISSLTSERNSLRADLQRVEAERDAARSGLDSSILES